MESPMNSRVRGAGVSGEVMGAIVPDMAEGPDSVSTVRAFFS